MGSAVLGYVIQEVMEPAQALASIQAVQMNRVVKLPRQNAQRRACWRVVMA
ncbi:hypothetical protein J5H75_20095 [Pseudomonas asiatica]|uniref:hypothetical protein n=1 Tax=Pseudomonas asiatica TaxID=2219225 RepID=UPI001AB005CF|nr:hypothetical protein [Pseudomonas asiatica]MBO2923978.1 hypothetical protein [Pseudomonas asiatica]